MADTVTTAYALTKPEVGASEDTWGTKINTDLDTLDTVVNAIGGKTAAATLSYADAAKIATTATGVDVTGTVTATGTSVFASLDISGDIDVDGTTNLDVVDIDGAVNMATTALVTGVLTTTAATVHTGGITMPDNAKAIFGAGSDLQIYHSGTHSYIEDSGTGSLRLVGADIEFLNADFSDFFAKFANNGAVSIYHDGSEKLATTATGIDVTGTAVTDGLTVAGNVSVDGGTIKLDGNYPVGTGNVALGDTALDSLTSGTNNIAIGSGALTAGTEADRNVAIGTSALSTATTGVRNIAIGHIAGAAISSGSYNTAVGAYSLISNTTASSNTAVGYQAGYSNTTGAYSVSVGSRSLYANTTGQENTAVGYGALETNTTGQYNVAQGLYALRSNTTASNNTAVGHQAGYTNTTGTDIVAIGYKALYANTNGGNTAVGINSAVTNTTGFYNAALGASSMYFNTTGAYNVALGHSALLSNTTASNNTAVGHQAGYSNTTSPSNVYVGNLAGYSNTSNFGSNTFIGKSAGYSTTGYSNTFVGGDASTGLGSGYYMSTGNNNTIIGGFNGNEGGLDIRTASNNIVLSDGDGNPRVVVDGSGNLLVGTTSYVTGTPRISNSYTYSSSGAVWKSNSALSHYAIEFHNINGLVGSITTTGSTTAYNTSSDYRLKTDAQPMTGASARVQALNPVNFEWVKSGDRVDGFLAHEAQAVVPEAVTGTKDAMRDEEYEVTPAILDENGTTTTEAVMGTRSVPDMQGIDQSKLVPLLTAALQEALTKIDAMEARIAALEGA